LQSKENSREIGCAQGVTNTFLGKSVQNAVEWIVWSWIILIQKQKSIMQFGLGHWKGETLNWQSVSHFAINVILKNLLPNCAQSPLSMAIKGMTVNADAISANLLTLSG